MARAEQEFDYYPLTSLEVGLEKTYAYIASKYAESTPLKRSWFDSNLARYLKWGKV